MAREDVVLKKWNLSDKETLKLLADNQKIFNNVRDHFPRPYSLNDATNFIKDSQSQDPPHSFAIYFKNELAGAISLKLQDDVYRHSGEIGYWVGEPFWGLGIGSMAVQLLTEYGFKELKLKRIFARVYEFNISSKRILEKSGYKLEGVFRKGAIKNGQFLDEYCYARVID